MNVLLVDDEIAVIQILKRVVDWESIGVNQVFCAYNAFQARNIVETEDVQIIVCDIEMPQESGIQFLGWVQQTKPRIVNIIMTSYADFSYAQEAVSIGVYKFLLKPVGFEALQEVVRAAIHKVEEESRREQQRSYGEYFERNIRKAEKILYGDILFGEILPDPESIDAEIQRSGMHRETLEAGAVALLRRPDAEDDEEFAMSTALIRQAEEMFHDVVAINMGKDMVWIVKGSADEERVAQMCGQFVERVAETESWKPAAVHIVISSLEGISGAFWQLRQAVAKHRLRPGEIRALSPQARDGHGETKPAGKTGLNPVIERVRLYIKAHSEEDITRSEIEAHTHINQDYLNRIFKQETGYSLMEFVQFCRIERAKELLKDAAISVSEVGGLTGFNSPAYFSKIFKKWTGVTPKEYRNYILAG